MNQNDSVSMMMSEELTNWTYQTKADLHAVEVADDDMI